MAQQRLNTGLLKSPYPTDKCPGAQRPAKDADHAVASAATAASCKSIALFDPDWCQPILNLRSPDFVNNWLKPVRVAALKACTRPSIQQNIPKSRSSSTAHQRRANEPRRPHTTRTQRRYWHLWNHTRCTSTFLEWPQTSIPHCHR